MNFQNVEFVISAASPKDFPKNRLTEIAFAGKSNVGKSSVINCLLRRKNFARVGETPGKTIHVNYFSVDRKCYLVDLPGYGYAKVSQSEKDRWGALMEDYFAAGRIDLGVLGVFYPRIINKSWRELPVMPKDFIPSLHIQGINIVWERSEKLSNLGDDIEYNIVASRAAQAALLKAEKEGLDNVDLTAIKNKPTPEPSDPSGSDGGSTGTDPGQGGSGGSSTTPDEEGGGGLGA